METCPWTKSEFFAWNDGRRIVDLQELAKQLHCKKCGSLLDLQRTEREARYGLASVLYIHCNCGLLNDVHTGRIQNGEEKVWKSSPTPVFEVNIKASINVLLYGEGSSHVLGFLALLDIPVPPPDDVSLLVPASGGASMPHHAPSAPLSVAATTLATATFTSAQSCTAASTASRSFQKSLLSSSSLVPSVPETFSPVDNDGDDSDRVAVQLQVSNHDTDDTSRAYHHNNGSLDNDVSEEENDVSGGGGDDDDDDDDYIPRAQLKVRLKPSPPPPHPSPPKKAKAPSRGARNARAKPVTKKATAPRKVRKLTIKVKDVVAADSAALIIAEGSRQEKEGGEEDPGQESSSHNKKDFDNLAEWSSTESEQDSSSVRRGGSDGAQDNDKDSQQQFKEGGSEDSKPKPRKRGRPRGSTDRAKRARKGSAGTARVPPSSSSSSTPPRKGQEGVGGERGEAPRCTACGKDFNSVKGYNVHMKRVHNQDMKGAASGRGGNSLGRGREEVVEPAPPEPVSTEIYVCTFCNQPFARDYTVLSHIKHKHWSPTLQPRECYTTVQLGSAILKMPAKKAKVHGLFRCLLCGSGPMTREPTAGHICVSPEGALACVNTCPAGKRLLYLEMNYLFTDKRGHLCDTCGDVFKVPVHLDTHLLKVHGVMTERHRRCQCPECGTTFSLPSHVKKHMAHKHPHSRRGGDDDDPANPTPTSTADLPQRPSFMCDLCGKAYDRLDSMAVHKRRHHTEGKRFQCEHCPKRFFGRSHWLNHTRQHFGASRYVCRWCNQQFSSSYSLKVHQRRHTGEKPYQCRQCGACFAQKTSLTVHMKKHLKQQQQEDIGVAQEPSASTSASTSASACASTCVAEETDPCREREAERYYDERDNSGDMLKGSRTQGFGSTSAAAQFGRPGFSQRSDSSNDAGRGDRVGEAGRTAGCRFDPSSSSSSSSSSLVGRETSLGLNPLAVVDPAPPPPPPPHAHHGAVTVRPPHPHQPPTSTAVTQRGELEIMMTPTPPPLNSDRSPELPPPSSSSSSSVRQHPSPGDLSSPPPPPPLPSGMRGQEYRQHHHHQGGDGFLPPPAGYKGLAGCDERRREGGNLSRGGGEEEGGGRGAWWRPQPSLGGYSYNSDNVDNINTHPKPSSSSSFSSSSDPMDGRCRLGSHDDREPTGLSAPHPRPEREPESENSSLPTFGGGAGHMAFPSPSFTYPGSSFYY
ncbi:uncharacterized protein LOC143277453 [Babylonia areolata]|uniref:uncharacterized protein LOC143277453 n=1 Tax=Babylonia areolata TaxID=304850 RepID=UPI003FCFCA3D